VAEGYPWIGCECCKGTVWVPFRMIRQKIPDLSAWTLDELGSQDEVRQVRQAAGAILLPREAKRRAGVCAELLGSATSHFYFARTSALDRIPDSSRTSRKVREVPILLQKSVEGFCEQ
jgi:hypothetical protein